MRFRVLATALSLLAADALKADSLPRVAPEEDRVVVQKHADGRWSATWHLAEPARGLRFERPASGFRQRVFEVATTGFSFQRDGDAEILQTDGAPVSEISVRFPEFDSQLPREYEFFRRFSDGSAAIYTGHLTARPLAPAGAEECRDCWVSTFEFVPPPAQSVIVEGRRVNGAARWSDATDRGTYVYVGAIDPVASDDVMSVIDPGLPSWLAVRTREAFPRLFSILRRRLGVSLPARPVVLFDYKRGSTSGYSSSGGTVPGLIQLGVEGEAWDRESADALRHLLHFLAHESAHMWNGEIVRYTGTEDAWMHEGSADAIADRVLVELGVISARQFAQYQSEALNDCALGLGATPLRASTHSHPRLAYTCGNMIALLTERSLAPGKGDIFDFWRLLIGRALGAEKSYDVSDYIAVWRMLGATDADIATLDKFLEGTVDAVDLVAALRARGLEPTVSRPPQAFRQRLARDVFARLMEADCGGRVGFNLAGNGFVIDSGVQCGSLRAGRVVVSIEGLDVLREGDNAYDAVQKKCEARAPVVVSYMPREGAQVTEATVSCTSSFPPRPPYVLIDPPLAIRQKG